MSLEKSLEEIKKYLLERYKDNLAGILVFGTANTGEFVEGKSDIDTMIFLKRQEDLDLDNESLFLINALKSEHFATQYFHTLDGIVQGIKERASFSTYITILSDEGSRLLYSTLEFEETKKNLRENPPSREDLKRYVERKDEFELEGYFKERTGFNLTKALFAHLRRKLQIMSYFRTGELTFDYNKCMVNLDLLSTERKGIDSLYKDYSNRKLLTKEKINKYFGLAKQLTERISFM